MRRIVVLMLTTAWLVFPHTAKSQSVDAIQQALAKARQDETRKIESARKKLGKAIETKIDEVAKKSDLAGLKQLQAQKDAFETNGELPSGACVAKARVTYEDEIRAARVEMRKALEKAKTDYVKARKVAEAEAIEAELRDIAPKVQHKQVKPPPPPDKIAGQWVIAIGERQYEADKVRQMNVRFDNGGGTSLPGMFWRKINGDAYSITFPRGGTGKVPLGRGGEQFDGRMADGKRIHGNRKI